jgi:hypothetical protein
MENYVRRTVTVTITETWVYVWQPDTMPADAAPKLLLRRSSTSEHTVDTVGAPSPSQPYHLQLDTKGNQP